MDLELKDQVAIVTGAGQGIGKGIAFGLAAEGVDVVAVDINKDTAKETAKKIESLGRKALSLIADVSSESEVKEMVNVTIEKFGKVDILVNNAGISPRKPDKKRAFVVEIPGEEFDRVIAVNLKSVFNCSKHVAPFMIKRGYGNIVNISSAAMKITDLRNPAGAHYSASKAAISNLTMSLANELAQYNIRVNAIAPGGRIKTEMMKTSTAEAEAILLKATPLGRLGLPEDIANAVLFLVSHMSSFITGITLHVNGGGWMG